MNETILFVACALFLVNGLVIGFVIGRYKAMLAARPNTSADPNACVCLDESGNPLNQCDECPR